MQKETKLKKDIALHMGIQFIAAKTTYFHFFSLLEYKLKAQIYSPIFSLHPNRNTPKENSHFPQRKPKKKTARTENPLNSK